MYAHTHMSPSCSMQQPLTLPPPPQISFASAAHDPSSRPTTDFTFANASERMQFAALMACMNQRGKLTDAHVPRAPAAAALWGQRREFDTRRIMVTTWNVGDCKPPSDLSAWIPRVQSDPHDMYY